MQRLSDAVGTCLDWLIDLVALPAVVVLAGLLWLAGVRLSDVDA